MPLTEVIDCGERLLFIEELSDERWPVGAAWAAWLGSSISEPPVSVRSGGSPEARPQPPDVLGNDRQWNHGQHLMR